MNWPSRSRDTYVSQNRYHGRPAGHLYRLFSHIPWEKCMLRRLATAIVAVRNQQYPTRMYPLICQYEPHFSISVWTQLIKNAQIPNSANNLTLKAAAHYVIRRAECRVRGGDTATFSENGATFRLGGRRNSKSRRRMSLTGVSAESRKKNWTGPAFSRNVAAADADSGEALFDATTVWPFGASTHGCKVQI